MDIFVLPGSGLMTEPRLPPAKSILRYGSAATFLIKLPLSPVRPPRGEHSDDVRLTIRVHNHQEIRLVAHPQGHEPLFIDGIGIFTGQGERVVQDRDRLGEANPVSSEVRVRFRRVPLEPHPSSVWTIVFRSQLISAEAWRTDELPITAAFPVPSPWAPRGPSPTPSASHRRARPCRGRARPGRRHPRWQRSRRRSR